MLPATWFDTDTWAVSTFASAALPHRREDDTATGSTTNTHGLLDTYDKVNDYLGSGPGGFLAMAQNRAKNLDGSPAPLRINITECNAKDNSARPQFLEWLAQWLSSNGGYRMLTFFPTDQAGPHSVTWQYVANALTGIDYTIDALNTIQNNYGGG